MSNKSSRRRRGNRGGKPVGLWIQMALLIGVFVLLAVSAKSDRFNEFLRNALSSNPTLSTFIVTFVVLEFLTNAIFAFSKTMLDGLCDEVSCPFFSSLMPVSTDVNLCKLYISSECTGILPIVVLVLGVIKHVVTWGGMLLVNTKYGFLYFYEPHTYWLVALFIATVLYTVLKGIVLGIIEASYENMISFRLPGLFYKTHIVYLGVMLLYFVVITPLSVFLKVNIPFLKTTLVNSIMICYPFIVPVISAVGACIVKHQVECYLNQASDDDEDEYDLY